MGHDEVTDLRKERRDRATELIAALILSLAALLSSYASFQAELWDGEQAANYALAEQARTRASEDAIVRTEILTHDTILFSQWLDAYASNDEALQRVYRQRFRPGFSKALEEWLASRPKTNPDAPSTPFSMPSYQYRFDPASSETQTKADSFFKQGQKANDVSDAFAQVNVILAIALFMGGIIQAFKDYWLRIGMLVVAATTSAIAISRILSLPAMSLI